jgi:hypothetical protein
MSTQSLLVVPISACYYWPFHWVIVWAAPETAEPSKKEHDAQDQDDLAAEVVGELPINSQ